MNCSVLLLQVRQWAQEQEGEEEEWWAAVQ